MTTSKLPDRPSLESLRRQAKKLARGIAAGDAEAIGRAHAQLPQAKLPLSRRDAQLAEAFAVECENYARKASSGAVRAARSASFNLMS